MSNRQFVFVDSRVINYQSIFDTLTASYDLCIIDAESHGLDQIKAYLNGRSDLEAIHIISHGSVDALFLGSTMLESNNLSVYGTQLASIKGFQHANPR